MMYAKKYPEFMTGTCLEWKPLIESWRHKEIIIDSMRFLTEEGRVWIYGFVLMDNHFHLIWQMQGDYDREDVQRDFLKFTGQNILRNFRKNDSLWMTELRVQTADREYQFWERNSLGIPLTDERFLVQKLNYIHNNPVKAGLCQFSEEYKYSSAGFYLRKDNSWGFLTHYNG